jgi:predicted RecA/RadA family phage recombinase
MAKNFHKPGEVMTVTAAANVNSGQLVVIGQMFGVATYSANTAEKVEIRTGGVWKFNKASAASTSAAEGANVYYDATNLNVTISATSNTRIGVAAYAFGNTDTSVYVRLNPSF